MLSDQLRPLSYVHFCFFLPWLKRDTTSPVSYLKVMFLVTSYTHQLPYYGGMMRSLESIGVVVAVVAIEQQLKHVLTAELRTVHGLVDIGT